MKKAGTANAALATAAVMAWLATGGSASAQVLTCDGKPTTPGHAGSSDNDVITGTNGDDVIHGGDGDDTIDGRGGNDTICGGNGADTIEGGRGDDVIYGEEEGVAYQYQELNTDAGESPAARDARIARAARRHGDHIRGNRGDDRIYGGIGPDTIDGGAGNDRIWGDKFLSESPVDVLKAIRKPAELSPPSVLIEAYLTLATDNAFSDRIEGGRGDDEIIGGWGGDIIEGGMGDDQIEGGHGHDRIRGNTGRDTLWGDSEDDLVWGDDGQDRLEGGSGNDSLFGGSDADQIWGDLKDPGKAVHWANLDFVLAEDGTIAYRFKDRHYKVADNDDLICGGDDNDETLEGGPGFDAICGGEGQDILSGGPQDDTLYAGNCIFQETGIFYVDSVRGGDGSDTAFVLRRDSDGDSIPVPDIETIRDLRENRDTDDYVDCELTWSQATKW